MHKITLYEFLIMKNTTTFKNINGNVNGVSLKFTGKFFNLCKGFYNRITPKYSFNVKPPQEPCVYLCRHLNLHGALTIEKCSTFDLSPYVYHVFTNRKTCFLHFYNYTFSKRLNKSKLFALLPSFLCSLFVPYLCSKAQIIPVYRNNCEAFKTIKASMTALKSGRSLIIFPNVDYTSKNDSGTREIYGGFLCLEKLYFKQTNKHLKFIPLTIDDELKTVTEKPPVVFSGSVPFEKEFGKIQKKIADAIF